MSESDEIRRKRILFQASRRGFKEADLLIGGFAAGEVPRMTEAELDQFEALLSCPDHDLYSWARGEAEPEPSLRGVVLDRLRASAKQ
jgi:antitoxin CptB